MATSGKFGVKKLVSSAGTLGVFDITSDSDVRIIVENAGPTNIIALYGKIQGQNAYELIDTIVGSSTKLIPVNLFDFLELEIMTYDSTGMYVDIAGSGFIGTAGSGGGTSGLVTVTNFPSTQNVAVTNTPNVNTGLNPLTDAQLRANPVVISGNVNTGLTQGLTDAELRAAPVPVLADTGLLQGLTDAELRATPVPVLADTGLLQGLTDAELRAAPVVVTGTVNTISGFATEAKQDTQITILNDIKTNSDLAATAQNQLDTITALGNLATEASLTAQTAVISSIDGKIEADNIKQKILKAVDRQQDLIYADFGTKNQRITEINYNATSVGVTVAKKTISYTLVGSKYRRDSIDWSIV